MEHQKPSAHLSLILPCYNGAPYIEGNLLRLAEFFSHLPVTLELMVVNDGSTDGTAEILERLRPGLPSLVALHNPQNRGKGYSVRRGVASCSGRFVIFTDSDLPYELSNVQTVLHRLQRGAQIVVANRESPESLLTVKGQVANYIQRRHHTSVLFNSVVRGLFGLQIHDTQAGLKGFQREAALRVFERVHTDSYLFDVEIFVAARKLAIPIEEIPIHLICESDYTTIPRFRYFFSVVPELLHIKSLERRGAYDAAPPHLC